MDAAQAELVVDLAKAFISLIRQAEPRWNRAFFRFAYDGAKFGSSASYVCDGKVTLIDPFAHKAFFLTLNEKSVGLMLTTRKPQAVLLLAVNNDFNYDIKFEYEDMERWKISKLEGQTGIPEGF